MTALVLLAALWVLVLTAGAVAERRARRLRLDRDQLHALLVRHQHEGDGRG